MALNRKYATLPDLDSAPDIYETPDLTDDNSTVPTTAAPTQSEEDADADEFADISRSRLRIDDARSRFLATNVDASSADFSDRVDSKRKSYKTSSRRERVLPDGTRELGDLSDDDDEESLERRIARLKREVEEAREEFAKRKSSSSKESKDAQAEDSEQLGALSSILSQMSKTEIRDVEYTVAPGPSGAGDKAVPAAPPSSAAAGNATYTVSYAPRYEENHALAKAADFDQRLVLLERALGVGSSAVAGLDGSAPPRAIIPTVENLHKQISTLSQASTANLDTTTRRVRALAQEVAQLNEAQQQKAQQDAGGRENGDSSETDQEAKINALYGTLPTIENLAPLLPALLDRLRSLRAIHSDAATASEALDRLEQQQVEMTSELKQWKEGLGKVEAAIREGQSTMTGNMKSIDAWVKDLEGRVAKMS